jgi:hypothetical protein
VRRLALAIALVALFAGPALAQEKKSGPVLDPPKGVELPIPIKVSLWVNSVSKIDEVEGTFTAELDVWLRWHDPRLAFDASATGLDRQEFNFDEAPAKLATIWTPQISISNLDKGGDERVALVIDSKGDVELLKRTSGRFRSAREFSRFPFDVQQLAVELRSPRFAATHIVFAQGVQDRRQSGVNSEVVIPNWRFEKWVGFALATRRGWTGRDHSVAFLTIRAHRDTAQYFFQLFLPFFTIMLFPPLALWVPKAEVMPRANMAFSGLFSLIAFSYSIFVRYPMLAAVDNVMVALLWVGYLYLAFVLGLIMTIHNPAFTSRFGGKHLWAEAVDYTTWAVPLLFGIALFGTIVHSM